jgi:ferrous iron transport protein B
LPIVVVFFSFFAILEDSGYLVRLSIMLDKFLKKIGLSGRATIPLVLGLGCGTMATIVTRTLETIRERYLVTFLLALTIPCSAQLGVILALLGSSFTALSIWLLTIICIFSIAGTLLNKFLKGEQPAFFMEVPPLRMPSLKNVLLKTYERLKWYFYEIIPVFILASLFIWIGRITYIFDFLSYILSFPAQWAGLPKKVGEIFLYGFFRRDFGIAGLYDMKDLLSVRQIIVSSIILTLFVPCIAQFLVMMKEIGYKAGLIIFLSVIPSAFIVGILINLILLPFIQ